MREPTVLFGNSTEENPFPLFDTRKFMLGGPAKTHNHMLDQKSKLRVPPIVDIRAFETHETQLNPFSCKSKHQETALLRASSSWSQKLWIPTYPSTSALGYICSTWMDRICAVLWSQHGYVTSRAGVRITIRQGSC